MMKMVLNLFDFGLLSVGGGESFISHKFHTFVLLYLRLLRLVPDEQDMRNYET